MDWVEGGALVVNPPWDGDSKTGVYDACSLATSKHGKLWLDVAIAEKVKHVIEIHTRYCLREERRLSGYGNWDRNSQFLF